MPANSRAYAGSTGSARSGLSIGSRTRAYFATDARRAILSALGLIWLLDGALQLQSFMYSARFVETLRDNAVGQPLWLESSIKWSVRIVERDLTAWNTVFALIQILIGLGLLYRPTVKPALLLSFAWALLVWWFAEAFGMLFMTMMANPLTGAPGAVLLYAIIGLAVWPAPRPGGLLGVRGVRTAWAVLWLLMAWLWLDGPASGQDVVSNAIKTAPAGMGWLSGVQHWAADVTAGVGLPIALILALLSAVIGVAVAANWRPRPFLWLAIGLNLVYWVIGQGVGGIFTGSGTDPNSGPLFILLALVLYSLTTAPRPDDPPVSTQGRLDGHASDQERASQTLDSRPTARPLAREGRIEASRGTSHGTSARELDIT